MQADDLDGPVSRTRLTRVPAPRSHPYNHLAAARADKVVGVPRAPEPRAAMPRAPEPREAMPRAATDNPQPMGMA